jgi:hypothetical protein
MIRATCLPVSRSGNGAMQRDIWRVFRLTKVTEGIDGEGAEVSWLMSSYLVLLVMPSLQMDLDVQPLGYLFWA